MESSAKESAGIIAKYSIIFVVMAIGIYFFFIIEGKSFIQYGDGYRQGYFTIVELKHNLQALFSGGGISGWSWSKGLGAEVGPVTDPFYVIAALFPAGHIELGYTIAILLRIYCSGAAFILFAREAELSSNKCLMGSLCYAFSGWTIGVGLVQAHFLINTVLFPLLILGIERIYKGKSPILFVLIVAYYLIRFAYFAYMAAIIAVIYIFIRYFAYYDGFKLKEYVCKIGTFILYGLLGIVISMVTLMPSVLAITGASTEAASETNEVLYSAQYYYSVMTQILSGRYDGGGNYAYLGISAFLIMLIPVGFRSFSIRKTPEVMVLICFIMYLLAFFGSMFNGFGYPTGRWTFMFVFFIVWCAIQMLDMKILQERNNLLIMAFTWIIMLCCTCGLQIAGLVDFRLRIIAFVLMNLIGALLALCVAAIKINHDKGGMIKRIAIFGGTLATIVFAWNLFFAGNVHMFLKYGEINSQLEKSTQRAGSRIEDDGFYRIDQVDGICVDKVSSKPANETLWWQTNSIYTYDSKVPSAFLKYNKMVGNNCGYSERVAVFSNDNRMGLDFLTGVKYFLGDDVNEEEGSSQYAGYGFEYSRTIDGVDILENKYESGLGFTYDKYISESEFEKLSRLEREQALLQGAVISEADAGKVRSLSELQEEDVKSEIKNINFEIASTDGVEIKPNRIIAHKGNASFEINVHDVNDSQIIVSFDNLRRQSSTRSEGGSFTLKCENEYVVKNALNKLGNQGLTDIADYDINIGYYENYDGNIKITLSQEGVYDFERFYVSAMGAGIYDECAGQLIDEKYEITEYEDDFVAGTVDSKQGGVLYLSILNDRNWDVYVDGKKAEKLSSVNIAFSGIVIDPGRHEVELRYNYGSLKLGGLVSLAGLGILIVVCLAMWYSRGRKNKISGSEG